MHLFEDQQAVLSESERRLVSFAEYVEAEDEQSKAQLEQIRQAERYGAYGSPQFIEQYGDIQPGNVDVFTLMNAGAQGVIGVEDLFQIACELLGVSRSELHGPSRGLAATKARGVIAIVATRLRLWTLSEVAAVMSRDHSSLSRLRRTALGTPEHCDLADEVQDRLLSVVRNNS